MGLISLGGTNFRRADLTDANFSHAIVKGAHFREAILTRTDFHLTQQLYLSRAYKTILANRTVLNLLVLRRPELSKSYVGLNLKGANLSNAELSDLDFTETDLCEATLENSNLQRANLTKVQALGTNFSKANLTASCLEAWNIGNNTQLKGVICEHIYLLHHQRERRPNSGTFAPGEFAKLFEEVLNTIDLIFRDGIDWQAFQQTLQTLQAEHKEANLKTQRIEDKGDRVMVVGLNANGNVDKPAIHQAFKQGYQKALKAFEQKYRALRQSKDQTIQHQAKIIEIQRQQGTEMSFIARSLAQQQVALTNKNIISNTSNSEAMQGNDQSQNTDVQGDFNVNAQNSVVSLRDISISGQVTNQINQLNGNETQAQLKDLLTQLKTAIEGEPTLSEDDKAEALEQVQALAEAGQTPEPGKGQKLAKRAMTMLKGITVGLTETTKLVGVCNQLLPAIGILFGL